MNNTSLKKAAIYFLAPAFLIYTLIVFIPILWSVYYSFFRWDGFSVKTFIGWENYVEMFTRDRFFWSIVAQTLIYAGIQIILQVGGGLLVAIFLSLVVRGRLLLQIIYYAPVIIPSVAICQIFSSFFSVTPTGVFNKLLSYVIPGFTSIEWLTTPGLSLVMAGLVEGYSTLGIYMMIFLAALVSIPANLTEAARIDGATAIQTFLYVKIPYIRNVIMATTVLVLNNSLRAFDIPFLLTNGGPGNTSELLSSYMYKQAFSSMNYGYGSALSVFIVGMCMVLVLLFLGHFRSSGENAS